MKTGKSRPVYGRFELRISNAQRDEINRVAEELELAPTDVIRLAIREFVKQHDAQSAR